MCSNGLCCGGKFLARAGVCPPVRLVGFRNAYRGFRGSAWAWSSLRRDCRDYTGIATPQRSSEFDPELAIKMRRSVLGSVQNCLYNQGSGLSEKASAFVIAALVISVSVVALHEMDQPLIVP